MVERTAETQSRLPFVHVTPTYTSWRFGSLEKSRDRSKGLLSSASVGTSVSIFRAPELGEGVEFTMEVGRVGQLHEGLATRFCKPHGGETPVLGTDLHLGEM